MNKRIVIPVLLLFAVALAGPLPAQQEVQKFTVPLTHPDRPMTLHGSLLNGGFTVEGHDGKEVIVEVMPQQRTRGSERANGMRIIPNTSLGLTVEEADNVVEIQGDWASNIDRVKIGVPRRASMELNSTNGGEIVVRGVEGQLELNNVNGEITALEIRGSVVAQTTNGGIKVTFLGIERDTPMSFVTLNGDVDVTFPGALDADLRVETGQGEIYTDFEFQIAPQKPAVKAAREGGRYRVELNQAVQARIGRGGPAMSFKTFNGDIFIRKTGE